MVLLTGLLQTAHDKGPHLRTYGFSPKILATVLLYSRVYVASSTASTETEASATYDAQEERSRSLYTAETAMIAFIFVGFGLYISHVCIQVTDRVVYIDPP